ncbi:hypothetical protein [Bifidobacterium mongoliense]|uniref:Uncharacterized protein n=1 Tax=Bifidobacterium mongoliense DSM 21395 TaxID=1437603 RepID=A0A087CAJ0_9BIFI|nr:hypothetical protein [Bifidobacterium mongoliense]KFI80290.1 hypothetical protein BMON_0162 [Bifidobacterium mongoliense DSM 21395]
MGNDLTVRKSAEVTMSEQIRWAKAAEQADILPEAYKGKPANILVAVGFGASMGLSPAESLYRISVIKGKPTMSAELIASQVRKAGHKLRIRKDEAKVSVTAIIVRADDPDYPFTVTRDMQWAKSMGLANNQNYARQPMTMLTWRAISAVAREACPEALYGAGYTPDEMQDLPEHAASEPVSVQVVATHEQRMQLAGLLKQGGVDNAGKARIALKALVGVDSANVKDVSDDDVLMMLDSPDMVPGRVRDALWNAEHPDIEPPHEAQEASEAKK